MGRNVFVRWLTRQFSKMNSIPDETPIGIKCMQILTRRCCPRLQINRLRCYQILVLSLTYLSYMTYHLTRKPISVVKSVLHRNCSEIMYPESPEARTLDKQCGWAPFDTDHANTLLGMLDSAFLFSYAGGMFVSGMVAERVDLRYFLSIGMLLSAIFCYLFGIGYTFGIHSIAYYLLVQAGAGLAQTTGWPGTVTVVGRWFGNSKKGLIFGIWNSHTSFGNIFGTLMASAYVEQNWSLSFIYPALMMGVVAFLVYLFLPPDPRAVGLVLQETHERRDSREENDESEVLVGDQTASLRPSRHSANTQHDDVSETTHLLARKDTSVSSNKGPPISLTRALAIPGVMAFSFSLFFAKLVSYTFLFWLPMYITTTAHLDPSASGTLSTVFDLGGIVGAILAGLVADWSGCPALVCAAFYIVCAPMLFVYEHWGATSYAINFSLLVLTGALVNGPYALITTAVAADLGTHDTLVGNSHALATVTAIIDGTGSVGAAVGPLLAGVVSSAGSWTYVFYMLISCNFLALLLLIRIMRKEITQLRQNRRVNSPRVVRIE